MKENLYKKTGIFAPEILLPTKGVDLTKYSVIACDQFTSEMDYWQTLEKVVGDKPSTLHLTLPEIYLGNDEENRINTINLNMKKYLAEGILENIGKGFILTVRKTPFVEKRIGLVLALDLEKYEYISGAKSTIRATEKTVEERIPPRLKIRKDADIELTHVMVLYNDETLSINEQLYENREQFGKVYDFTLNQGGGSIEGYFIKDTNPVVEKFAKLLDEEILIKKYGENYPFLFAVGDGNHSLATAKTHWNEVKKNLSEKERETHPARYALCEIVNVYDKGIYFEPIFRYVTDVDNKKLKEELLKVDGNFTVYDGEESMITSSVSTPETIKRIDAVIKNYIDNNGGKIDYVHGEENVKTLVKNNGIAVLFPKMEKGELFSYVVKNGSLPRKTFSMGEGVEKRYYLEGKKIK